MYSTNRKSSIKPGGGKQVNKLETYWVNSSFVQQEADVHGYTTHLERYSSFSFATSRLQTSLKRQKNFVFKCFHPICRCSQTHPLPMISRAP